MPFGAVISAGGEFVGNLPVNPLLMPFKTLNTGQERVLRNTYAFERIHVPARYLRFNAYQRHHVSTLNVVSSQFLIFWQRRDP